MFIDRKEVGRPGDFSGMSEDELDKRIRELTASEEAGIGAAAGEGTALRQSPAEATDGKTTDHATLNLNLNFFEQPRI
jgi:hypothetical protein